MGGRKQIWEEDQVLIYVDSKSHTQVMHISQLITLVKPGINRTTRGGIVTCLTLEWPRMNWDNE